MLEIKEVELVIHDLIGGNATFIDEYLALYNELFPQYVRYIPLMRQRAQRPVNRIANEQWHQWLLIIKDQPVGLLGFFYNSHHNVGVLMDFAIKPEARNIENMASQKLAQLSLQLAMQQLVDDSLVFGHTSPLFMIAEVEHPPLLRKYEKYGYFKFPVDYYEPPYPTELMNVSDELQNLDKMGYNQMYLGAFQIAEHPFDSNNPEIIKIALLTMLVDHYGLSLDHWLTQKMLSEIPE